MKINSDAWRGNVNRKMIPAAGGLAAVTVNWISFSEPRQIMIRTVNKDSVFY